VLKPFEVIFF